MDIKNKCLDPIAVPKVTGTTLRILRCGKCVNCLRQRKNELMVRTFREFVGQSFAFLTFTYSDENCPIQVTRITTTKEGVTNVVATLFRGSDTAFFQTAPFIWKMNKDHKRTKRYAPIVEDIDNGFQTTYFTTNYDDLKNAIKRFRIKHPRVLKQFIAVPEYGSVGYRPHYHMLVLGLSDKELKDLVSEWPYGHVAVDNGKNPVKANDPSRISNYIAKYCVKGKFDCPYIAKGYCRKPRRSVSKNYGLGQDFEQLKKVLMCTQELGITSPWLDLDLSERQLSLLASRRKFTVNRDFNYVLPKYLVNKAFKKTIKTVSASLKVKSNIYPYEYQLRECSIRVPVPMSAEDKEKVQAFKDLASSQSASVTVRYHSISSPLQKKVANYTLARLVLDARRQLDQKLRSLQDLRAVLRDSTCEEAFAIHTQHALEQAYISDLEANSIY